MGEGFVNKIMGVKIRPPDGDEQIAFFERTAIDRDAGGFPGPGRMAAGGTIGLYTIPERWVRGRLHRPSSHTSMARRTSSGSKNGRI